MIKTYNMVFNLLEKIENGVKFKSINSVESL